MCVYTSVDCKVIYRFKATVVWSFISVSLADDGRMHAATHRVHHPPNVIIVDYVGEPEPDPRHPLREAGAEAVEGDGDLHEDVQDFLIVGAEQHHVVVVGELVVGDGHCGGRLDGIHQPVFAVVHGVVVDPQEGRAVDVDGVAVTLSPLALVDKAVPDYATVARDDVVDVESVDNYIGDELDGDACTEGDADVGPTAVNGLVGGHDKLLPELDDHVALEDDPEGPVLDDRVPQGAGHRVLHIVVRRVRDHVDLAPPASVGLAAETLGTVCQLSPFLGPVFFTPPAPVYRVRGSAFGLVFLVETPPLRAQHPACTKLDIRIYLHTYIHTQPKSKPTSIRARGQGSSNKEKLEKS